MSAHASAFARPASKDESGDWPITRDAQSGLTKREYFAAAALTGLASRPFTPTNAGQLAEWAVKMADAVLLALDGDS